MTTTRRFQYGSRQIDYLLVVCKRKTLGISVNPEMNVVIKAPEDATIEKINNVLLKKAPWIIKQLSFFLSFHPRQSPERYVNGASLLYLGRQYQLKVQRGLANKIDFDGRYMLVTLKPKASASTVVKKWYRERAKSKFAEFAEPIIGGFSKYSVTPSGLFIQNMSTRWGSCTVSGKIILNPELLKAPRGCIEYVIVHELCHLVHRHHTKKFFELQKKEFPEWEMWKNRLEKLLG
jgi:predicted metal-dependent hydrolase